MPKKKSWFRRVRDYFFPVTDKQEGKRKKRKKRWLFRWMKAKRPPSLAAPPLLKENSTTDGLNAQSRDTWSSANASEVLTVEVAKEISGVVKIDDSPRSMTRHEEKSGEVTVPENEVHHPQVSHHERHNEDQAATMIQTAFRGYLARKALKALKGLVRLQAIIRGRAVRRQAVATLKCLQSIVNIQSQVCATRYQMAQEKLHHNNIRDSGDSKYERLKIEVNSHRRWDDSLLTKEEENLMLSSKSEAMTRRMKTYTFNGRHSADFEHGRSSRRLRNWVEQYVSDQVPQKEEIKRVDTIGGKQLRLIRNTQGHQQRCIHGLDSPTLMLPRKSLHHRNRRPTMVEDKTDSNSRVVSIPAYMASTESAKAKARSTSLTSPRRLRPSHSDAYSDGDSPYKCKISPISSINSERTWSGTTVSGKNISWSHYSHPRSHPNIKGIVDPSSLGLSESSKDLGLEHQSWLLNWN